MVADHISSKKVMVTIIWGVFGFYVVDFKPPNTSYDSTYFVNNILIPLSEKREQIWSGSKKRKMWIHLDNSRIHNLSLHVLIMILWDSKGHPIRLTRRMLHLVIFIFSVSQKKNSKVANSKIKTNFLKPLLKFWTQFQKKF